MEFLGMTISNQINVGNILTICSLVPGFFWWLYTNQRQLSKQKIKDAESGSLRVILSLLRELDGKPIGIIDLKEKYNAPKLSPVRKAYCGFDFYLHDTNDFEKSIYALDWEGKIDFVGTQRIKFRFDTTEEKLKLEEQRLIEEKSQRELEQRRLSLEEKKISAIYEATPEDAQIAMGSLKSAISNPDIDDWELEKIARTAILMNKQEAISLLRSALTSDENNIKNKVLAILGRVMTPY